MDKVFIKDLEVEAVIGVYDWEREVRQLISINLEMNFNTKKAGRSDKIEDALPVTLAPSKTFIALTLGVVAK